MNRIGEGTPVAELYFGGTMRVVIVGAGISGLSLAFFLERLVPHLEVVILEKKERVGGWVHTEQRGAYLFEQGARTFKKSRSPALLSLVEQLGLHDELIFSSKQAEARYLWTEGRLRKVPSLWWLRQVGGSLLKEWRVQPYVGEESVWDFAARRFGTSMANLLFDPLVLGIYGGDAKQLSMNVCFAGLKEKENRFGSLTKAFFAKRFEKKDGRLFSFRRGAKTLPETLQAKLRARFLLNCSVQEVQPRCVLTDQGKIAYDALFCATDLAGGRALFPKAALSAIEEAHISVVHIGYQSQQLPIKAFGYLVPSSEGTEVLGTVFDSEIFPEQNSTPLQTRMTMMLRGGHRDDKVVITALKEQLGIEDRPDFIHTTHAALPQYHMGHHVRVEQSMELMHTFYPRCFLLGTYLSGGASVNECIAAAEKAALHWARSSGV